MIDLIVDFLATIGDIIVDILTMTKRRRQSAPLLRWGIVSLILHRPTKMSRALARESVAAAFPVRSCLSQARWPQN